MNCCQKHRKQIEKPFQNKYMPKNNIIFKIILDK